MADAGALFTQLAAIVADFNKIAEDITTAGYGVTVIANEYARDARRLTAHVIIPGDLGISDAAHRIPSAPGTSEYVYPAPKNLMGHK